MGKANIWSDIHSNKLILELEKGGGGSVVGAKNTEGASTPYSGRPLRKYWKKEAHKIFSDF